MRTTIHEPFERSSSRPADRLDRLCRVVKDVRVREHLRRADRALRDADHPELTTLSYLTALALFVAPLVALIVVALFP
jgi:hypothetical protein